MRKSAVTTITALAAAAAFAFLVYQPAQAKSFSGNVMRTVPVKPPLAGLANRAPAAH